MVQPGSFAGLHIYTAHHQPATRWIDSHAPKGMRQVRVPCRHCYPAWCCRQSRWAAYLTVQVFYDSTRFWCRPGRGCKAQKRV